MVSLVGAGPGDPGLITVKGLRALRQADVVVFDRLIARELLDEAPAAAERIDAGKAPGRHALPQAAINALLVDRARRGRRVVRLKGGDPFVFGRGGEEMQALRAAGVAYEVIPGVSSAIAVPAAAGIPVTMRGISSSVTIATGREGQSRDDGTLVILMGVERLQTTAASLIASGRNASTPVAVIESGTTPSQREIRGTLADIAARAKATHIRPPAVIVVGEVVAACGEGIDRSEPSIA